MQIIVNAEDQVLATHRDDQDVVSSYPAGCRALFVPDGTAVYDREERRFLALAEIRAAPLERTVRIIDGGRISAETLAELDGAATVGELRTALKRILIGSAE
jgi:hypothetical protein